MNRLSSQLPFCPREGVALSGTHGPSRFCDLRGITDGDRTIEASRLGFTNHELYLPCNGSLRQE